MVTSEDEPQKACWPIVRPCLAFALPLGLQVGGGEEEWVIWCAVALTLGPSGPWARLSPCSIDTGRAMFANSRHPLPRVSFLSMQTLDTATGLLVPLTTSHVQCLFCFTGPHAALVQM